MTKHFYVSIKEKPQGFYQETYCPRYRIATFASPILAFQDILCLFQIKKKINLSWEEYKGFWQCMAQFWSVII